MAEEADPMKIDDDSDDDSEDSEGDVDASPEDMETIMTLEGSLQASGSYELHAQYVAVLRKCGLKERLRTARQAMQQQFPLNEHLWIEWLNDELKAAAKPKAHDAIAALFELAVQDYLSVPIWAKYLEFLRDHDSEVQGMTASGLERFRSTAERALSAGGLHVAMGSQLWDLFRNWELSVLAAGASGDKQSERVRSLFHRQLQVPLAQGPAAMAAYKDWESDGEVPAHVQKGYEKAQAAVALRAANEAAVAAGKDADSELLAAYMAYTKLEEAQGDPARVQVIYERALAAFPLTHFLWLTYTRYLEAHLKIPAIVNGVFARAVRNTPWVGVVWARALNALERSGASEDDQAAMYQRAVSASLQSTEDYIEVMLARLDALRRKQPDQAELRAAFRAAVELLQGYFPDYVDRSLRLTSYWADCELLIADDTKAARAVWEDALKTPAGRYAETWAGYIAMERSRRNVREARSLYKRCHSRRLQDGGQAAICVAWLRFEREEGSAEEYLHACLKAEPILATAAAAAAAAADAATAAAAQAAAAKAPQLSKEEMKKLRQERDPHFKGGKAGAEASKPTAAASALPPRAPESKKRRGLGFEAGPNKRARAGQEPSGDRPAAAGAAVSRAPNAAHSNGDASGGNSKEQPADSKPASEGGREAAARGSSPSESAPGSPTSRDGERTERPVYTDRCTAFVKNIAPGTTDDELREAFASCGRLQALRHLRQANGDSRGFAYLEFADDAALQAALQLSGVQLNQYALNVAKSQPPGSRGGGGGRGGGRDGGFGRGAGMDGGSGRGGFAAGRGRGGRSGGRGSGDGGENTSGRQWQAAGAGDGASRPRVPADAPRVEAATGAPRQRLLPGGGAPAMAFVPRSVTAAKTPGKGPTAKSNADFRSMFLKKESGAQ